MLAFATAYATVRREGRATDAVLLMAGLALLCVMPCWQWVRTDPQQSRRRHVPGATQVTVGRRRGSPRPTGR